MMVDRWPQLEYASAIGSLMYAAQVGCLQLVVGLSLGGSKKQTCISHSTMEAEFIALAATGKEAEWLRDLMMDIPLLQIMCQQCRYIVTVKPL
ncbi:hypothetical protein CK203_005562 [Vitis vinifera]|uniref:Retrovirus-related Pol polyprotein from transposon TNT 1-94 n=1 Tax=Vitis vinifera TaxID=29760 RepID=A0A438K463_VITVI|nr:hypothetical protein CK203_005562 [Vitis vinifera]